jgi:hypothetical protein
MARSGKGLASSAALTSRMNSERVPLRAVVVGMMIFSVMSKE